MENQGGNFTRLDFYMQSVMVSINTILLLGLVGFALLRSEIAFTFGIFLLYGQVLIGFYQVLASAVPHLFHTRDLNRYIHIGASVVCVGLIFFSLEAFENSFSGNPIMEWLARWGLVMGFPQVLLYFYYWITWKTYK